MQTPESALESDSRFARRVAALAGDLLLELRAGGTASGGEELKAMGDRASQELLAGELAACRPGDAVLSEEAPDDAARLDAGRVWIIDPLDGTREYSEGRHDWAVHVALWESGRLTAAAVALPGLGSVLGTEPAEELPSWNAGAPLRMAVSRSRPPAFATDLARVLEADLLPMGSAGYKIASVVRGETDLYVHAGGQYEWDSAAPVAVAQAAGLHASRVDGSPLAYNSADPSLPDLVVCRRELSDRVLSSIRGLGAL